MRLKYFLPALLTFVLAAAAGCGQKGPLYLPDNGSADARAADKSKSQSAAPETREEQ